MIRRRAAAAATPGLSPMKRARRPLPLSLAAATLLVACGGSSGSEGAGRPTHADSATQPSPSASATATASATGDAATSDASTKDASTKDARWDVFDGDVLVLEVSSEPGPLMSTALPPPDPAWRPPVHPFLSASARSAAHESKLRGILDASKSLDEFLRRLREAGFRVVPKR